MPIVRIDPDEAGWMDAPWTDDFTGADLDALWDLEDDDDR